MDISGPTTLRVSRSDLLDSAGVCAEAERLAQVAQLHVALDWALANGRDSLTVDGRPGRRTARFYGGDGTPEVANTAGAELGARLDRSSSFGDKLVADALDLAYRLPRCWARVEAGEVRSSYARMVATRTRELSADAAAYVDGRVAKYADGRVTWGRFESLVEAAVRSADLAAAEAREKAALEARFAKAGRSTDDGMRGFFLRTDVAGVAKVDAAVAYLAQVLADLGCAEPLDTRRAMAMVVLADPAAAVKLIATHKIWKSRPAKAQDDRLPLAVDGDDHSPTIVDRAHDLWARSGDGSATAGERPVIDWSRLLPTITIFVHLYGGRFVRDGAATGFDSVDSPGIVRVEGIGALTEAWLASHLRLSPQQRVTVRPVFDLEGQAPVDAWEIPDRHRQAVRLMTPADVFPYGSASTNRPDGWRSMQIDHTVPWKSGGAGGETGVGNYGPLTAFHHNLKTHCGWDVQQPYPGIYVWRDPSGAFYLVDHTGTRRLGR